MFFAQQPTKIKVAVLDYYFFIDGRALWDLSVSSIIKAFQMLPVKVKNPDALIQASGSKTDRPEVFIGVKINAGDFIQPVIENNHRVHIAIKKCNPQRVEQIHWGERPQLRIKKAVFLFILILIKDIVLRKVNILIFIHALKPRFFKTYFLLKNNWNTIGLRFRVKR